SNSLADQPSNFDATLSHHTASPGPPLMTSIGLRRNERRTAFFNHSLTTHAPSLLRSATRTWPLSRSSSAASTASRTSPRVEAFTASRSSKACTMVLSKDTRSGLVIVLLHWALLRLTASKMIQKGSLRPARKIG